MLVTAELSPGSKPSPLSVSPAAVGVTADNKIGESSEIGTVGVAIGEIFGIVVSDMLSVG